MATATDRQTIRCASCGRLNRIDETKIAQGLQAKCGSCGELLSNAAGPVAVNESTFPRMVEHAELPVLVDFWAEWCGPCHALAPTVEQLSREFSGRLRVFKVNTDENPALSARFQIRSIPTLILFVGGKEIDRMLGVLPKHQIASRIQQNLR